MSVKSLSITEGYGPQIKYIFYNVQNVEGIIFLSLRKVNTYNQSFRQRQRNRYLNVDIHINT